ncbi:MAG: hypothetical protein OEY52_07710 [Gammaproteobacteria bacterium]|nr:hypothetical protein [Gammaproteobacteria bacterium]
MAGKLVCWHCGEAIGDTPKPFPRLFKCRNCEADLHVCLMCRHYNPRYSTKCDHELAEAAREIDLANFCHYIKLKPNAFVEKDYDQGKQAEAKLKALFGDTAEESSDTKEEVIDDPMEKLKSLFANQDLEK